jgi:hypothetical protein
MTVFGTRFLYNEQSRAVAYCRQPASTVTPGIEPRWDPWPLFSVKTFVLFSFFRRSSFDKKGVVGLFYKYNVLYENMKIFAYYNGVINRLIYSP